MLAPASASHGGAETPVEGFGSDSLLFSVHSREEAVFFTGLGGRIAVSIVASSQPASGPKGSEGEEHPMGVPGMSWRGEGHLRQPPVSAAWSSSYRHRRSCSRGAQLLWPSCRAGAALVPFLFILSVSRDLLSLPTLEIPLETEVFANFRSLGPKFRYFNPIDAYARPHLVIFSG